MRTKRATSPDKWSASNRRPAFAPPAVNIRRILGQRIEAALTQAGAPGPALVRPASKPEFGDYQADGIMRAAKRTGSNPRALGADVVRRLDLGDLAEPPALAGPGFLNIRLKNACLADRLQLTEPVLAPLAQRERVVVDYSCPNLAKQMHAGHLRSTIIGDAVARVLEALGQDVIRQNHVGDWGTQFGMLLAHLGPEQQAPDALEDLEDLYRQARLRFDADADFATASRREVVALQQGDPKARASWQRLAQVSLDHCDALYRRLGVSLTHDHVRGESAYSEQLAGVVEQLDARGLLTDSENARCVFLPELAGGAESPPVIVQKSDGGYLYATTDLAAIRYRAQTLAADRVLYFTDSRQSLHFRQVFAVARAAGLAPAEMRLEHMPFGAMLGPDGRPFKTREGDVVRLNDLLDEAEARAARVVAQKSPDLGADEQARVARCIGIGAVKYADLAKHRTSDYLFKWDQLLSFEGNTAPYLLYAHARIQSLFRRGGLDVSEIKGNPVLDTPEERNLALTLIRFQEVVEQVAEDGLPHLLCGYLYELASRFTRFYETSPILKASGDTRQGRLCLAALTGRNLAAGLGLLGLDAPGRL